MCLHTRIDIVSKLLNGFNYCDLVNIVWFNINHLFKNSEIVTSIALSN